MLFFPGLLWSIFCKCLCRKKLIVRKGKVILSMGFVSQKLINPDLIKQINRYQNGFNRVRDPGGGGGEAENSIRAYLLVTAQLRILGGAFFNNHS